MAKKRRDPDYADKMRPKLLAVMTLSAEDRGRLLAQIVVHGLNECELYKKYSDGRGWHRGRLHLLERILDNTKPFTYGELD